MLNNLAIHVLVLSDTAPMTVLAQATAHDLCMAFGYSTPTLHLMPLFGRLWQTQLLHVCLAWLKHTFQAVFFVRDV